MSKLKRVVPWEDLNDNQVITQVTVFRNEILIRAVNSKGERIGAGDLITLGPDGLRRMTNVAPDLGFPLDKDGRIVLDETAPDRADRRVL